MSGNEFDSDHEVEFDPFADLDAGIETADGIVTAVQAVEIIDEVLEEMGFEKKPSAEMPDGTGSPEYDAMPPLLFLLEPPMNHVVSKGSVFVYDLETVPDESRFPRPVRVEKIKRPDLAGVSLAKLITETVQIIQAKIPKLSEEQLLSLQETEANSKKPRKGVLDAIAKQIDADNADDHEIAMMEWRKLSFSPLCCKIVALGIESWNNSVTMVAKNPDEEREILRVLWDHILNFETRCGYNITAFDDAVLIFRSMQLGVDATQKITRKKYGSRESIDLMQAMFTSSFGSGGRKSKKEDDEDWAAPAAYSGINGQSQKLKDVCKMLGIVPLAGYEMSGDQVFDLVEKEFWDEIATYVHSDAVIEFELYGLLNEYLVF